MCEGSSPFPHGAPCVHQLPKMENSLIKWRFQRNVAFSHLASRDARRRAPRVPFGTTQEEFPFITHMQVLLPASLPIDRASARAHSINLTTLETQNARRSNQTAHDETWRARRQDLQVAPCASTARRRHRPARTAAIRGRCLDYPKLARYSRNGCISRFPERLSKLPGVTQISGELL